jgi:hypothetical protein
MLGWPHGRPNPRGPIASGPMSRRIEVELTSEVGDGTWRWRAAGAREPRGILPGHLLYEGAKVGDVVRVEAEFDLDGINVIAVFPPRPPKSEPERLELRPRGAELRPITTTLARRSQAKVERRAVRSSEKAEAIETARRRRLERPRRAADESAQLTKERKGVRGTIPRQERQAPKPPEREAPAAETARVAPRRHRLPTRNVHRHALLEALSPQERPIAEQLMQGGMPAVRTALETQNRQLVAEGKPPLPSEPIIAMAEQLLPRVKAAVWRDRAEAAAASLEEVPLRVLRMLVAGADAARDEESRELAARLRQALEERVSRLRQQWEEDLRKLLADNRVLRALRLSAQPPDSLARMPSDLAMALASQASAAFSDTRDVSRWLSLLEAAAASPVRRAIKIAELPKDPSPDLLEVARSLVGRLPSLAPLLGMAMPPPPRPLAEIRPRIRSIAKARAGQGRTSSGDSSTEADSEEPIGTTEEHTPLQAGHAQDSPEASEQATPGIAEDSFVALDEASVPEESTLSEEPADQPPLAPGELSSDSGPAD